MKRSLPTSVALLAIVFVVTLSALSGCNEEADKKPIDPIEHEGYFAVVSNNYSGAIAISLLDQDGEVLEDNWVGSSTQNDDLRSPLSEDVVLPTVSESRRVLTTIERGLGVITRFDLENGEVLGVLRTDESDEDDEAAYHSNPYDFAYISETSAWVSRWQPNLTPDPEEHELGSDLIEFDLSEMERTDRRIDLSELNAEVEETEYDADFNPVGTVMTTAHARPGLLVPANGHIVVALARTTEGYTYAEGMVAAVNPEEAELTDSLVLEDLSNCGEARPVPGAASHVVIVCTGAWGDGGAAAGIVEVEVSDEGELEIVHAFRVAEHEEAANTNSNVVVLGSGKVVAVAPGELDADSAVIAPDKAYAVDLESGEQTEIWESEGAFTIGLPAFDAETGILLVPDAGNGELYGVERFTVSEDLEIEEDDFIEVAPETTLVARVVLAL